MKSVDDVGKTTHGRALNADLRSRLAEGLRGVDGIRFAMLFGSAAEGPSFRDVDVAVFVDRERVAQSADFDFEFKLEEALRPLVAYPVDVRVINDAPLGFRYNVSRGVALWVNDEEAFYHFLERTWDDWFDFEPIALQYLKEME